MLSDIMRQHEDGDTVVMKTVNIDPYLRGGWYEQGQLKAIADGNYAAIENDLIADGVMDDDSNLWLKPRNESAVRDYAASVL